jgi:hypothetical protein
MRRFLSFLMASAILLAGLALAGFEIVRADGVKPFVLFGARALIAFLALRKYGFQPPW